MIKNCEIVTTEYRHKLVKKPIVPTEKFVYQDYFTDRIEKGEIDPRFASIPSELDEEAEKLVYKQILDNQRTVYQITFENPYDYEKQFQIDKSEKEETNDKESELISYIRQLYYKEQMEKVLAPPETSKRLLGYIRPKLLRGSLTAYQDIHGRTGGMIMLRDPETIAVFEPDEKKEEHRPKVEC